MGNSIWGPYGAHMDVPRWVPDESLLQNPHRSHMGCPYRTHIITHLGPIWVPHSLLAGEYDIVIRFKPCGRPPDDRLSDDMYRKNQL